jgi:serine/threonine-protein kinase
MTDALRNELQTAIGDRYVLDRELGRGGMATVYLARDQKHSRLVALKVLDPELGAVLGAERFLSEIRVTATLQDGRHDVLVRKTARPVLRDGVSDAEPDRQLLRRERRLARSLRSVEGRYATRETDDRRELGRRDLSPKVARGSAGQSALNASAGLMRAARRAGSHIAASAMATTPASALAMIDGSSGVTSNVRLPSSLAAAA